MSKERELELAAKYFEEGKELNGEGKYDASNTVLKKANEIYQKWKEWEKWLKAGNEIGWNYKSLGNLREGIKHLEQFLQTALKHLNKEHTEIIENYNHLGTCYCLVGKYNQAQDYFEKALEARRKYLGEDHSEVAASWNNLGICFDYKGDYNRAIRYHTKALHIREALFSEAHVHITDSWNNLGVCFHYKGDYERAIDAFQKALRIRRKLFGTEVHLKIASSLDNIGSAYTGKGDYDHALDYHREALHINKKNWGSNHLDIARSLTQIGNCYNKKKDNENAIFHSKQALNIYQHFLGRNHPSVAGILQNLGNWYAEKNDFDQANTYLQESHAILIKCLGNEHPAIATSFYNLSLSSYLVGNHKQSILYSKKALELRKRLLGEDHPDVALCHNSLGKCHLSKRHYTLAINHVQQAIIILIASFDKENIYQNPILQNSKGGYLLLETLAQKAQTFFERHTHQNQNTKDLQAALSTIQLATGLITDIRQSYKAEGSKHTLSEKAAKTYNLAIKIALKTAKVYNQLPSIPQHAEFTNIPYTVQGCKTLVFDFTEQSKAILLLSSLKDSEAKSSSNIPLELLKKEKQLKIELNYLSKSIATQEAKGDEKDDKLLSKFQSQYFDYKQQYDELIERFEADYPEYYQLKYAVETASVEEVQKYLASISINNEGFKSFAIDGAALISYHIAKETIYIFVITPRFRGKLSNDYQIHTIDKPSNFSELLEDFQTAFTLADVEEYMNTAGVLFDLLLKSVLDGITGSRKLIIIPHEQLSTLSFDALVDTRKLNAEIRATIIRHPDFSVLPYLVKDYEISYHYSATMLLHSVARQEQKPSQEASFVGFAPVNFNGSEDTQLALRSRKGQTKVMRSNRAGEKALSKLPNTENEVKEVFQLFEAKELDAQAFLYASANKENLFENASKHKYVLIATHGYAQDENAGLSGIYLASKGEVSDTYNSYLLHTSEAYHLQLDADLVVLSSCSSGVGKLIAGEGMMAINRGFLYAGASNIIFTHFDIPDESSGELVKALFGHILEGEDYASALRKAKLKLISRNLKTPEDWAGYALIGA
ncbi:MAG: tetratricopeptide repeat protein [Chitinophagales bacterium]